MSSLTLRSGHNRIAPLFSLSDWLETQRKFLGSLQRAYSVGHVIGNRARTAPREMRCVCSYLLSVATLRTLSSAGDVIILFRFK